MKTLYNLFTAAAIAASLCTGSTRGVVVIHEIYTAGGSTNPNTLYSRDYIELFNDAATTIDISGWSLDYASAAGSFSASNRFVMPPGTRIQGEDYFLIAVSAPGPVGEDLVADLTTTVLSLSGAAGKLRLSNSTVAADAQTVIGSGVSDFIGYGSSASLFEGSGPAPFSTTLDGLRLSANRDDHLDTNNNAADFYLSVPTLNRARPTQLTGDANNDGVVDVFDFDAISQNFGAAGGPPDGSFLGDANDDGVVDVFDFDAVSQNFGDTALVMVDSAVPEPASIVMLTLVGLVAGVAIKRVR